MATLTARLSSWTNRPICNRILESKSSRLVPAKMSGRCLMTSPELRRPPSRKSGIILSRPTTTAYDHGTMVLLPFPFSDQSAAKIRPAIVASPVFPSDDLLVVAVSSVGGALRPGEFSIQFWREAGLIHPSFVKRAIACDSADLIRKQMGRMRDSAAMGWFVR